MKRRGRVNVPVRRCALRNNRRVWQMVRIGVHDPARLPDRVESWPGYQGAELTKTSSPQRFVRI